MRETFTSGSVRGVRSNPHPYRDQGTALAAGVRFFHPLDSLIRRKKMPSGAKQAAEKRWPIKFGPGVFLGCRHD